MFVEMKKFVVKKGFSGGIVDRFTKNRSGNKPEGLLDISVMKNLRNTDTEEIIVEFRWESQESFTKFKKSDAHKAGHANKSKERPDFMIDVRMDTYHVL